MSSFLYGSLTRNRLATQPSADLVYAQRVGASATSSGLPQAVPIESTADVKRWQDALTALVPAEVLGVHALAMSLGTTQRVVNGKPVSVITSPTEMSITFWCLAALAGVLFLAGARSLRAGNLLRALVVSASFVLWTMIQPNTAFDALGWELSTFARTMIAVFGAVVVGLASAALAAAADRAVPDDTKAQQAADPQLHLDAVVPPIALARPAEA